MYLPNGTDEKYATNQNEFGFTCNQEGRYLFDIVVKWADESEFNQNSDFYSTSVDVGDVEEDSSGNEEAKNQTVSETSGLYSISIITAIISITIIAISRRQR